MRRWGSLEQATKTSVRDCPICGAVGTTPDDDRHLWICDWHDGFDEGYTAGREGR
jgi:hypothetical protein